MTYKEKQLIANFCSSKKLNPYECEIEVSGNYIQIWSNTVITASATSYHLYTIEVVEWEGERLFQLSDHQYPNKQYDLFDDVRSILEEALR